jgi:hypothetical protein
MTVYILTENQPSEGGAPVGVYSTLENAKAAAAERAPSPDWFYYLIYPVELDAPQVEYLDSFRLDR